MTQHTLGFEIRLELPCPLGSVSRAPALSSAEPPSLARTPEPGAAASAPQAGCQLSPANGAAPPPLAFAPREAVCVCSPDFPFPSTLQFAENVSSTAKGGGGRGIKWQSHNQRRPALPQSGRGAVAKPFNWLHVAPSFCFSTEF